MLDGGVLNQMKRSRRSSMVCSIYIEWLAHWAVQSFAQRWRVFRGGCTRLYVHVHILYLAHASLPLRL